MISVISPVYGSASLINELITRLETALFDISDEYEIILVEDHSPDNSWEIIKVNCDKNNKIKGIKLSRNFGQHYAITAVLEASCGEWVVIMDCDLQDRPEEIPLLYQKALEGYYIVQARRKVRKDRFLKRLFSKIFYSCLSWLTGTKHDPAIANFGIYHRKVVDAICSMKESIRYFPTMVKWVGFKSVTIDVQHDMRMEGKSSYSFVKLLRLALDIILAYSDKPLRLTVKAGLAISGSAFIFALYTLYRSLRGEISVMGYASLIVSIWFFSGLIIFILGIVGLYVGKTFEGVKNRPVYVVEEKSGFSNP